MADTVNIAYNNDPSHFELDDETQTMVQKGLLLPKPIKGQQPFIPYNWEIIKPFLDHYSLIPTWINCHFTWGWLDKETGTWTGAVGKVRNYIL